MVGEPVALACSLNRSANVGLLSQRRQTFCFISAAAVLQLSRFKVQEEQLQRRLHNGQRPLLGNPLRKRR